MPTIVKPKNWKRLFVAGWESTKQKVSGTMAFSCLKGRWLSPQLPRHACHPLLWTSPEMMLWMVPPRWAQEEKITAACRPGEIIPPLDFAKSEEASGYLKKILRWNWNWNQKWNLWLIFKKFRVIDSAKEGVLQDNSTGCLPRSFTVYKIDTWSYWTLTIILYFSHSTDEKEETQVLCLDICSFLVFGFSFHTAPKKD